MRKWNKMNEEEFANLKLMSALSTKVICQLTGRSHATVERIKKAKDYAEYAELTHNTYKKSRAKKDNTQDQIDMFREAAEITNIFPDVDDDIMNIVNGINYNNELLNRLIEKLDKLCEALGV